MLQVSGLIQQISDGAQEQLTGISQVNEAVGQLDAITQSNASLVEQVAASATCLQGQAETVARKVAICQRAYALLTDTVGIAPTDIIFDPNILAIATGIEEHNEFAKSFIEAARIIKATGNYGESFERNVGSGSKLGIARGLNNLWNKGGIQYSPPIR